MFPLKVGVLATAAQLAGVEPSSEGWTCWKVGSGLGLHPSAACLCPAHTTKKPTPTVKKSWEETPRWAETITSGKTL